MLKIMLISALKNRETNRLTVCLETFIMISNKIYGTKYETNKKTIFRKGVSR